jgi:solute carrier family 25 protein 33/36
MPLEVIKTQLQTSRIGGGKSNAFQIAKKIYQSDRFLGFYRGLKPMLLGIIPTRAVYFWSYTASKTYFNNTLGIKNTSPTNHLLSAFSAGITSNTLTNPIWMVKTRFQILADTTAGQRAYSSYGDVIKTIFKEEGLQGFFKGLTSSYIGCFEGTI